MGTLNERVFVYGTLRRGGRNHHLLRGARLLGRHRTAAGYTMLDLGGCPGVVAGGGTAVIGEVYAVDAATLRRLDRLEEYPRVYTREPVATPWGPAWLYLFRGPGGFRPVIPAGDWLAPRRRLGRG